MPFLAITRLKLKSVRQVPAFLRANEPSFQQAMASEGFMGGKALLDFSASAWTQTLWRDADCIRRFYLQGEHRQLMIQLNEFACEASTCSMEFAESRLPSWWQASRILQAKAHYSQALKTPSPHHQRQHIPNLWFPLLSRALHPKH